MKNLLKGKYLLPIFYHDIFSYPLTRAELSKWGVGEKAGKARLRQNYGEARPAFVRTMARQVEKVKYRGKNYFILKGRKEVISARSKREVFSGSKLAIAKKAAKILSLIPTVRMVAITGSLAMRNAAKESDIDLMVITQKGTLWLTRLISLISLIGQIRRFDKVNHENKLCLNLWLDEGDLVWPKNDRNLYTAHEIAQIIPLVNKNNTYEKFIWENRWILDWWPNAVRFSSKQKVVSKKAAKDFFLNSILLFTYYPLLILEPLARTVQYAYMRSKITKEIITPTRAIFHPNDMGKMVLKKLRRHWYK